MLIRGGLYSVAVYIILAVVSYALIAQESAVMSDFALEAKDEQTPILPGFTPLTLKGSSVSLGAGRVYHWGRSLLPREFSINGEKVVGPIDVEIIVDGKTVNLIFDEYREISVAADHVEIVTSAHYKDKLALSVRTLIEYDGSVMSKLEIIPTGSVVVDKISISMPVKRNQYTNMLAYKADTIRSRTRQLVFPLDYQGDFLNAVGFPNGEHSFWFFADNAKGWIWNGESVTEVHASQDQVVLKQNLIGARWTIDKKMEFKFNFLLTPVKELDPEWRKQRIARRISHEEAKFSTTKLWWTTAFAHIDYPYTELPADLLRRVPRKDIEVYPGLVKNKKLLSSWRKKGIERIPYFSAHVLSTLDPELQKNRTNWEVQPPFVTKPTSDKPFTARLAKPWLSHRAEGYSDYLIHRFDVLIDELGMEGVYFDQGGVIQSQNPAHGLWVDSNGKVQASLDILALRSFFKRLATLFYIKDKKGIIAVHNSMAAIIPAYTFVESMVQGEEYIHSLEGLDYISSTTLAEARGKFSGHQYGITVTWLSELWSPRVKQGRDKEQSVDEWMATEQYQQAFKNFMAIALLNDSRVFSLAPFETRAELYKAFDRFEIENSELNGYWSNNIALDDGVWITFYQHKSKNRYLAVVSNLGNSLVNIDLAKYIGSIDARVGSEVYYRGSAEKKFKLVNNKELKLNAKDFMIVEFSFEIGTD